jgi:hypothetical protein
MIKIGDLSYEIMFDVSRECYEAYIEINNNLIANVCFYDEVSPQKYEIEIYNKQDEDFWKLNFHEFLDVLKEIEKEFEQIKKNQEKQKNK